MEFILYYLALAMAASFSSIYEVFWPVLKQAIKLNVDNEFTRSPKLTVFVVFVVNTVVAPFWVLVLLVPSMHVAASIGISSVVLTSNNPDLNNLD